MPPVGTRRKPETAPPDTVRGQGNGNEEPPQSAEELLAANLKEEGLRVYDESGKVVKDPVAYLIHQQELAIQDANVSRKAGNRWEATTGVLARRMLDLRRFIVNPQTGKSDWGGATQTYKDLIKPIRDAAMITGETPATAGNRLQRRCRRMLAEYVAEVVNEVNGLGFEADDLGPIVKSGMKALENEDEKVQSLVRLVNDEFRAGKHDENEPYSPFELSKTEQANARLTKSNQQASEGRKVLEGLPNLLKTNSLSAITGGIVILAQAIAKQATSDEPRFGAGRAVVARNCMAAGNILRGIGLTLAEQKLSEDQDKAFQEGIGLEVTIGK